MPYFPSESDFNSVTLKLHNGEPVTLVERQLSVGDRRQMTKRALAIQYDFRYKQRQADDIDKRIESAGLDRQAYDVVASEAIDLMAAVSIAEVYATVLSMRFASWDVYESKAAFEADTPITMTREAITEFAESKPQNAALLNEIMELLRAYDEVDARKNGARHENSGVPFMTTQVVR